MINLYRIFNQLRSCTNTQQLADSFVLALTHQQICSSLHVFQFEDNFPALLSSYPKNSQPHSKKVFGSPLPYLKIHYTLANPKYKKRFRLLALFFEAQFRFLSASRPNPNHLPPYQYHTIINAIDDGIVVAHLNGDVFFMNKAIHDTLPEVHIGSNLKDLSAKILTPASQITFRNGFASRLEGIISTYELENIHNQMLSVRGVPIRDEDNNFIATVAVIRNITSEKNIHLDLEKSKAAAEKARSAERLFLANMSHEIRTPINAVIGLSHLLLQTQLNNDQLEYLNGIKYSADTLLNLISNILDISKIEAGELQLDTKPFSINQLLISLQQFYQQQIRTQKSISIVICHDDSIKYQVVGDPVRLHQIIANLLTNACKFTPSGTVGISVDILQETPTHYQLQISVRDTGIGIAHENITHIFENFKQANPSDHILYGGTGLGLSIVKNLVELQGGKIYVDSQIGKGSTFSIQLQFNKSPLPEISIQTLLEEAQNISTTPTTPPQHLDGLRILVAEDNPLNQKLIARLLENWHCVAHFAQNGQQAIDFLQSNTCDLILMDVHMPILDGCQTTQRLRNSHNNPNQHIPIIALTAAALLEEKQRAFDAGMNEFLTKPFIPDQLFQLLRKYNNQRNPNSTPNPTPTLDLSYLIELSNNDTDFIAEILHSFLQDSPTEIQTLNLLCQTQQNQAAAELLHKMQSTYALVGLRQISKDAKATEKKILQNPNNTTQILQEIQTITRTVQQYYPLCQDWLAQNKK